MSTLTWRPVPDGTAEIALGKRWRYLIADDGRSLILTRTAITAVVWSAAAEGALNAIALRYAGRPDTDAAQRTYLRRLAQEYEDGQDMPGQPAWRHEQET